MKNKKELIKIWELLDQKMYDNLTDYEKGAKDILNYIFFHEDVDDNLIEKFKQ